MATMLFYAKSDCIGSDHQRERLVNSGNTIYYAEISVIKWTREKLLPFMRGKEPLEIMDSSSPEIRMGKIDPLVISFEHALNLLVDSPHLIKGPLIKVDNLHMQGLQDKRIERYIDTAQEIPQKTRLTGRTKQRFDHQPPWQTPNYQKKVFTEVFA